MTVIPLRVWKPTPWPRAKRSRAYAIIVDFDAEIAERLCGGENASGFSREIASVFAEFGFSHARGNVYFGDQNSDAVHCVMAVQEADRRLTWFRPATRALRMLRVDEDSDLRIALCPFSA